MDRAVTNYLSMIGRRGGRKSRRKLDSSTARAMVKVREARKIYKNYHSECFWSYDPDLKISITDVRWVGQQLIKHGNQKLWKLGKALCQ